VAGSRSIKPFKVFNRGCLSIENPFFQLFQTNRLPPTFGFFFPNVLPTFHANLAQVFILDCELM
jgi:hypothetical protein